MTVISIEETQIKSSTGNLKNICNLSPNSYPPIQHTKMAYFQNGSKTRPFSDTTSYELALLDLHKMLKIC